MTKKEPSQNPTPLRPTEVELEILEVLWQLGPAPMGKIHDACLASRPSAPGYTTTQKMVQVMRDKGLVKVDRSTRPPLYRAAELREKTQHHLLHDVTKRVFGGSAKNLVLSLLSSEQLSPEETEEIKTLIIQAKQNQSDSLL